MLRAVDIVRPALAKFYDSLSDEQKGRFNVIARSQASLASAVRTRTELTLRASGAAAGLVSRLQASGLTD